MVPTPEERAVAAIRSIAPVVSSLPSGLADNLKRDIATAINQAVEEDRAGLQDTLRLCAVAFDEVLAAPTCRSISARRCGCVAVCV